MMAMYKELLWIFTRLPGNYIVLDTETTGLPDGKGQPDIVSLGITAVRDGELTDTAEFRIRPHKRISAEAQAIHGIGVEQAACFKPFDEQWKNIAEWLQGQLVVIHNASFDWPIVLDHVARYGLSMPPIQGLFCSQKAATPWAQLISLPCSQRGPSLNTLTTVCGVDDLRAKSDGMHGAALDSQQTALVVEALRRFGGASI